MTLAGKSEGWSDEQRERHSVSDDRYYRCYRGFETWVLLKLVSTIMLWDTIIIVAGYCFPSFHFCSCFCWQAIEPCYFNPDCVKTAISLLFIVTNLCLYTIFRRLKTSRSWSIETKIEFKQGVIHPAESSQIDTIMWYMVCTNQHALFANQTWFQSQKGTATT